jgi:signal transduction histidine kinase
MTSEDAKLNHDLKASNHKRYRPLLLLAIASLVISSYAFVLMRSAETHRIEQEFQRIAQKRYTLLHLEFESYFTKLRSLLQLFAASETITREEFTTFVKTFTPGLTTPKALEWVPRVRFEERQSYEESAQENGLQGYRFTELNNQGELVVAGIRDEYFPVFYVAPYAGNEFVLGFDLASEELRREALYRARDTNKTLSTSRVLLFEGKKQLSGILLIQPVYRPEAVLETVTDRRQSLEGFFVGVTILGDIGRQLFDHFEPVEIDHYVFNQPSQQAEQLIFSHRSSAGEVTTELASDSAALRTGLYNENHSKRSDAELIWIAKPTPEFFKVRRRMAPWLVLGGGLLFFGMILTYVAIQIKRLALVRMFATEQTKAKEKLAEANRELEAFVYTVSHDLRSPLTPIMGYAELLQDTYKERRLDDQALDFLKEIQIQGNRMMILMEDLLTLAKVGHLERPDEPVDVHEVVRQVLNDLAISIASADIEVRIGELPKLRVPEVLLTQIFDNLIGNAVRYAGKEGGPIEVEGKKSGGRVQLFVRDHGSGIQEDERGRIFETFFRGSTGKSVPGTGVGLATVRKIAMLYDGNAWVEETPGGGATFCVEMEV